DVQPHLAETALAVDPHVGGDRVRPEGHDAVPHFGPLVHGRVVDRLLGVDRDPVARGARAANLLTTDPLHITLHTFERADTALRIALTDLASTAEHLGIEPQPLLPGERGVRRRIATFQGVEAQVHHAPDEKDLHLAGALQADRRHVDGVLGGAAVEVRAARTLALPRAGVGGARAPNLRPPPPRERLPRARAPRLVRSAGARDAGQRDRDDARRHGQREEVATPWECHGA